MMGTKISVQALLVGLIWTLLLAPALAQESATRADADSATSFHLSGVLVSGSGRSALVNGGVYREGDRVAGAEIIAIREGTVRLRVGSRELIVRVGADVATDQLSGPDWSRRSPGFESIPKQLAGATTTKVPASTVTRPFSPSRYGPVMPGETLSDIAARHLADGTTMNQMMIALFDANPEAFGGNINILREGAMLHIPDDIALRQQPSEAAAAEVMRHMDLWRSNAQQPALVAESVEPKNYGPVSSGETLSEIAARVARNGATINQTMMALFDANPEAFGGNINILREGAVLRIPDDDELRQRAPAVAAAEVLRHVQAWRPDSGRSEQSARADDYVNTPRQDSLPPSGGILLSMTSSE